MEERRRPGRPRLEQPQSTVSTRLPPEYHDRLIKLANDQDASVSKTVRQLLILRLRPQ
jgi:hypothetical protein